MIRPSSDKRRAEILDSVLRVIIDIGYTEMTVADVAKAAGVSTALVHYHFSSKAELIAAALRVASDEDKQFREAIAESGGTSLGRIARILCESFPINAVDGTWLLWVESWGETRRNEVIRSVMADLDRHEIAMLAELIVAGVEAEEFACADPEGAATRLTSLRDGLAIEYTLFRADDPPDELIEYLRGAIQNNLGLSVDDYDRLLGDSRPVEPS
ncbi:MAG: hypothetical protein RL058_912 [Actinomycetota bacterium]|jgi:AcrR family transcriptional regulator